MLNSILAGVQGSYKKKDARKKEDPLAALQRAAQEREQKELDAFKAQARTMIDRLIADPKETEIRFPPYEDRRKRYIVHGEAAEVGLMSRAVTLEEDPDGPKHLFVWKPGHEPERIRQIDAISRVSNESRNNAIAFATMNRPPKKRGPKPKTPAAKEDTPSSASSPVSSSASSTEPLTGRKRSSPDPPSEEAAEEPTGAEESKEAEAEEKDLEKESASVEGSTAAAEAAAPKEEDSAKEKQDGKMEAGAMEQKAAQGKEEEEKAVQEPEPKKVKVAAAATEDEPKKE